MTKTTPGPWSLEDGEAEQLQILGAPDPRSSHRSGRALVCTMPLPVDPGDRERAIADGRMLAASLDLHAAIRELLRASYQLSKKNPALASAWTKASAVMDRAEGIWAADARRSSYTAR